MCLYVPAEVLVNLRVVLFAVFAVVVAVPLQAGITVSIQDHTVSAEGLTPGGGAVFFSVGHEYRRYYSSVRRVEKIVPDDDRDGKVVYRNDRPVPWKSIWCVVDLKTGAYAIVSPDGYPDRRVKDRASRRVHDASGVEKLEHQRDALYMVVIRPGGDVWTLGVARGGYADDVKEFRGGGKYRTSLDKFRALTPDARPLNQLSPADVVLAIDPGSIEVFAVSTE
jgi:hypothetical protein